VFLSRNLEAVIRLLLFEHIIEPMQHLSSNFTVHFESPTFAHARSLLTAAHSTHSTDFGQNFFEGGYYYWSLRKQEDGEWKISFLTLDAVWWHGESLGLNEQHPGKEGTNGN
jgi:hypothetical protein